MSKRQSAKYKLDRRMGENIWGRPKSPVNRREYGPGQHGQRRKSKISDYGIQLRAKQKLKGYFHPRSRARATKSTIRTILTKSGWSSREVKAMRGIIRALVNPGRTRGET